MSEVAKVVVDYLSILALTVILHEMLHLAVARVLGYRARLKITRLGLAVVIEEYARYKRVFDIVDSRLRRHYYLISLAPYVVVPIYAVLALCLEGESVGVVVALKTTIVYHMLNVAVELVQ